MSDDEQSDREPIFGEVEVEDLDVTTLRRGLRERLNFPSQALQAIPGPGRHERRRNAAQATAGQDRRRGASRRADDVATPTGPDEEPIDADIEAPLDAAAAAVAPVAPLGSASPPQADAVVAEGPPLTVVPVAHDGEVEPDDGADRLTDPTPGPALLVGALGSIELAIGRLADAQDALGDRIGALEAIVHEQRRAELVAWEPSETDDGSRLGDVEVVRRMLRSSQRMLSSQVADLSAQIAALQAEVARVIRR